MPIFLRRLMPYLVLVLAVFAVYANVYDNEFFYDDEFLIVKNSLLRSFSNFFRIFTLSSTGGAGQTDAFYRPIQTVLYLFVFQIFGLSTVGFHLLNIILHATNTLLLWTLGRRLGFSAVATWFGALIWAVHPVHTEAVTYMSATADPGHILFQLLALCLWVPAPTKRRTLGAAVLFLLALLTKEPAIVFPALAMVCRFIVTPRERRLKWQTYLSTIPFWILAFAYLIARRTVLDFHHTFVFYETKNIYTENMLYRVFTFLATLPEYVNVLVWPETLVMDRNFPVFIHLDPPVIVGLILFVAFVAQVLWGKGERGRALTWGGLWAFAAHVPQSGVLLPVNSLFLEHWLYVPSMGLSVGLSGHAARFRWPKVLAGVALCAAGGLGARTFVQNRTWRDPITFYRHILEHNERDARVHNNLAMALSDAGDLQGAESNYRRAIEISDVYPQSHYNLALLLLVRGQRAEAVAHLKRSIELDPTFELGIAKLKLVEGF